jgi:hypothetical protein
VSQFQQVDQGAHPEYIPKNLISTSITTDPFGKISIFIALAFAALIVRYYSIILIVSRPKNEISRTCIPIHSHKKLYFKARFQ